MGIIICTPTAKSKILMLLLCVLSLILISGCDKNPVTPSDNNVNKDTTSHKITWQRFEFGDLIHFEYKIHKENGSELYFNNAIYNVAIIDENDIWAVGRILFKDTVSNNIDAYNVIHWDGSKWQMLKDTFYEVDGRKYIPPIYGIIALGKNDIYFTGYNVTHWNGTEFETVKINMDLHTSLYCAWGSSGNNLYVGGNNGWLLHYDGNTWEKIETNTTIDIWSIYGSYNSTSGKYEILAAGYDNNTLENGLLQIEGTVVKNLTLNKINKNIWTTWFVPNECYFVSGMNLYKKDRLNFSDWQIVTVENVENRIQHVAGDASNNIYAVGGGGLILHYNGSTWKNYLFDNSWFSDYYQGVSVKNSLVAVTGSSSYKAIILLGRRGE